MRRRGKKSTRLGDTAQTGRSNSKEYFKLSSVRQLTPEIVNVLIRRIETHSKDKGINKVKADIYFTAVELPTLPMKKERQAATKNTRRNHPQFNLSA